MNLNQQAWDEYVIWRRKMKFRKLKDFTVERRHKELMEYTEAEQARILKHSIKNEYQGIFPEKFRKPITTSLGEVF